MTAPNLTIEKIIQIVCEEYGISVDELKKREWQSKRWGESRRCPRNVSTAKQVISYFAMNMTKLSIRTIAVIVGYPDRTAISKGRKITRNVMSVDKEFKTRLETIEQKLLL